jgi:hypothetical protein
VAVGHVEVIRNAGAVVDVSADTEIQIDLEMQKQQMQMLRRQERLQRERDAERHCRRFELSMSDVCLLLGAYRDRAVFAVEKEKRKGEVVAVSAVERKREEGVLRRAPADMFDV